jgi:hypothetical protein
VLIQLACVLAFWFDRASLKTGAMLACHLIFKTMQADEILNQATRAI